MPLDTNLLYGEMMGSWISHLAIPFGASLVIGALPYMELSTKVLLLIAASIVLSFVAQFAFLMFLQASSCKGVQNYGSIFAGALIAAGITGAMVAIPLYVEPMRLAVSQLFGSHKSLLTPEQARMNEILTTAGKGLVEASVPLTPIPDMVQKGGASLTPDQYDNQTFKEMMIGSSYWAAFAGAYGIGVGSMIAAKCQAT
jgi:hypothetical protein